MNLKIDVWIITHIHIYYHVKCRQDRRGVNGNQKDGCDSIVVSVVNTKTTEDELNRFFYTCWKMVGSGAMFVSMVHQFSIIVFRSSKLKSNYAPQCETYIDCKGCTRTIESYRYDGLYIIKMAKNDDGHILTSMPSGKMYNITFELQHVHIGSK